MKNPELNLSNEEIGLLNISIMSSKANWLSKLATAGSEEEAKFCVTTLDKLDVLHGKLRVFADEVNTPKENAEKNENPAPPVDDNPKDNPVATDMPANESDKA